MKTSINTSLFYLVVVALLSVTQLKAQNATYNRLTLTNNMDQLRFDIPDENRYWFMSKPSVGYAYGMYSPDDGYWFTTWKTGTGDMILHKGKLGIGTTTPTQKLDVNGTIGHSNTITSKGANYSSIWMKFKEHENGNSLILGGGGLTAIGSGESANKIDINRSAGEEILYLTSDNGTRFISNLQDGWNNRVEAMEIKSDGKIGIGTSTPTQKLDVNGTIGHSNTITSKGANYSSIWMKFKEHENGNSLILGGGGLTAIGSGESANKIDINRSAGEEILYLTSDNGTRFISNLQDGWNNRVEAMEIKSDGKIGIGTTTPSQKLSVAGTINSEEIIVEENVGADFVFEASYELPSLQDIEAFIEQNQHLPGIAPASQMIEEGVKVGELQMQLLQKIEEMTLIMIEMEKRIQELESLNK